MKDKERKVKEKQSVCVSKIGGQALMEGVMMRGVSSMAMAVRAPEGEIMLETKRLSGKRTWYKRTPVIRGLVAFFDSMVSGVKTLMRSAEASSPEDEMPSSGWMSFAVFLGLALGIGLFILLPSLLCSLLFETIFDLSGYVLLRSLFEGVLRIAIFVLYLLLVSRMKDIRRTFMYHGAEHRTINCYEHGLDMTVENVQKCSTRHNRCGTTFLFFVMIISILIFSLANWLFEGIGINKANLGNAGNIFTKMGIRLALLPLVAGLSYELLKFLAYLPDNWFTKVLRAPGLALQRLTTYTPTDDMAEVALLSFMAVLKMDADQSAETVRFGEYKTSDLRQYIKEELKNTNADDSEADWILCDVLKLKRSALDTAGKTDLKTYNKIKAVLKRRKEGEPLMYILGYTDFYNSRIILTPDVLIPRPETELLCERAIKFIAGRKLSVLDLCTGSGCIALTIAKNTQCSLTASDVCEKALETAKKNLKDKAQVVLSDMFASFSGVKFDLIVSNPPYIESGVIETLEKEVREYEPRAALDGGEDGLKFYRTIALDAPEFLNAGGMLMLEIGFDQAENVKELLSGSFEEIEVYKDYCGNDRIITAKLKTKTN